MVNKDESKPTPTRTLTRLWTSTIKSKILPRCVSGCNMVKIDPKIAYNKCEIKPELTRDDSAVRTLIFSQESTFDDHKHCHNNNKSNDINDSNDGVYCNLCHKYIQNEMIYHCPNEISSQHSDGFDICLDCAKNQRPLPILNSMDINGLASFILSKQCQNIVILCGAGISRNAGIKDFRSNDGIYKNLNCDNYNLTKRQKRLISNDPQYIFNIELFKHNPVILYQVLGDMLGKIYRPTITHLFFRLIQNKGLLKWLFTQNIDGLERLVGIEPKRLIEVHGTFSTASCIKCNKEYNINYVRKEVINNNIPIKCDICNEYTVKPDCVLFGQDLPEKYYDIIQGKLKNIDLLIIMGTSLSVTPVSELPKQINTNCVRVLMNLDNIKNGNRVFNFNRINNNRDIFLKDTSDNIVKELCKLLGWDKELNDLELKFKDISDNLIKNCDLPVIVNDV